jgi:hypothetical protein
VKKFILGLLIGIMLTIGVTTYAVPEIQSAVFSPDIKLVVDGEQLDTQIVSVIKSGEVNMTNYVSARSLAEALGATVEWDGATRTISVAESVPVVESSWVPSADVPFNVAFMDGDMPVYGAIAGKEAVFSVDVTRQLHANGLAWRSGNSLTMVITRNNRAILEDVPTFGFQNKVFVTYEYYKDNIKPLLN